MSGSILKAAIAGAALLVLQASLAGGQIGRRPVVQRPPNWFGASVGIVQGYGLSDGTTSSTWNFGSGLEYAARVERPTRSGIRVGLQASYANAPLTYQSSASAGCSSCDARARVTQLMGLAHFGEGYAFHPVYELSIGAVGFSNFRQDGTDQRLGPTGTDYDLRLALGYGFGFGFSPNTSIEIVQELGTILHQKTGLAASSNNYPRVFVTRLGGKIAF